MNKDIDKKQDKDEKRPYGHFTTKFPIPEKFEVTAISIEQFQTAVNLRKEWKDLTNRPRSQGFIISGNLITAQVELVPAFNKNDGSTRKDWEACTFTDKEGKQTTRYLVSLLERGQMNGDLHTRSIARVGWGDIGGAKGGIIAGAIWIDELGNVSMVMNRSSSQNFFSITWDDDFIEFFRTMTANQQAHALSIKRELPRAIFQQLINDIFVDVGLSPLGDLLTSEIIPGGVEGIKLHLQIESEWEQNKPRCQVMLIEALLSDTVIDEKASAEDVALLLKNNHFTLAKLEKQPEYKIISYNLQLIYSIMEKKTETFAELTTKNPELIANVSLSNDGSTALMYAAFMGDYDKLMSLIKLIKQYHPDQLPEFLDAPNVHGVTALMMAGLSYQIDCVKALCWAGARLDCLNNKDQDIFAILAPLITTDLYNFLKAFSLYSSTHRTELEGALQNQLDIEEFVELLENGLVSNISLADEKGNNLLMLAVELDAHVDVIEDIILHFREQSSKKEFNEFMNATNLQGLNVWQIALQKRDPKVFKLLQKYLGDNHDNDSKDSGLIYNFKLINSIGDEKDNDKDNDKDQQDEKRSDAIILIEGFAKFLQNNFLEAKQQNSIAKICRMKLLGYVLPILQTSTLFEIQLIRKIVSACNFMHHPPSIGRDGMFIEQDGLPSISAKYPTKSDEGQLIPDSKPPQYGTRHSTACFYQLCREMRGDKVLTTQAALLLTELRETYPSLKFSADNRLIAENKNIFEAKNKLSTIQVLKAKLLWSKMVGEKISDSEINEIVIQGEQMLMAISKDKIPAENKLKLIQDLGDTVMECAMHASKMNGKPINASLKKLELQCQLIYCDIEKDLNSSTQSTFSS